MVLCACKQGIAQYANVAIPGARPASSRTFSPSSGPWPGIFAVRGICSV